MDDATLRGGIHARRLSPHIRGMVLTREPLAQTLPVQAIVVVVPPLVATSSSVSV